ncbi:tau-tubulin kinase 1-like [Iris pallida]|uniref:Tau-tubulin kinase 1-like n=1 Tax=Iris pallida TaxID=29817 RepID=A0AAX6HFW7_IRIPA|nr:tau-tubulin kinase 1-like [Iris pallida]
MATEGEETVEEYESDPEDVIVPSAMRRREASDDEDGSDSGGGSPPVRKAPASVGSDGESDGQGGAPAYVEDDDDDEEYYEEEEVEEEEEVMVLEEKKPDAEEGAKELEDGEEEGEKKENEPYAVPTAGAFYMHDDRFRENVRGRHRRMAGGRSLWESKDDRAWVHDRFEEMNLQDTHCDEGRRNSRGRFRGRGSGRIRGRGRGYARGNVSRPYHDDDNNQNRVQKSVRGRGPRRYESLSKNTETSTSQYKQSGKPQESTSNAGTGKPSSQTSDVQPNPVHPRKQFFGSNLSSASPPFYPSGSSNQDISGTQKRDAQSGATSRSLSSSIQMENNFPVSQSGSYVRGKNVVDSLGHDRQYVDDILRSVSGKTLANAHLQSSVSSVSSVNTTQSPNSKVQGRGLTINSPPNYQATSSVNQIGRGSVQIPPLAVQQRPVQSQLHPSLRISTQQFGQRAITGNQGSSPPQGPSTNASEVGEADSPPGSSKSKTSLVAKGKTSNQDTGRGFLSGGSQVIGATGAMGLNSNDQNFSGTPAMLPVMQFGGQHPGGLGVPAVGMAFPGYVAQPQLGFGNSEMTWLPVITGAAGALGAAGVLGASYCSSYIALDGNYQPHSSGQTSSSVASRQRGYCSQACHCSETSEKTRISK